ncbi:Uncharacterised protein [Streptococcus pneumoniae]|nr:Uncharacterised protein [Streptococcus pneumoniae]
MITLAGVPATTAPAGTSCVTIAPAATIAPSPTRTPSKITALAPINTLSSMTTGDALGGSMTPANTDPAPTCTFLPVVARPLLIQTL